MSAVKTVNKARPRCFSEMYDLTETEMAENCVLGGCRGFNDCKKFSPSPVETIPASLMIPAEPAVDLEYGLVRW